MTDQTLTPVEHAVKVIDELICLFRLYEQDYHVVDEALAMIASTARVNPQFSITAGLIPILHERGWVDVP